MSKCKKGHDEETRDCMNCIIRTPTIHFQCEVPFEDDMEDNDDVIDTEYEVIEEKRPKKKLNRRVKSLLPVPLPRVTRASPHNGKVVYERLTIYMPYEEIFQLIREGKINVAQAHFIESRDYGHLEDDEREYELQKIEQEIIGKDFKKHMQWTQATQRKFGNRYLRYPNPPIPTLTRWLDPKRCKAKERNQAKKLSKHLAEETSFVDVYNFLHSKIEKEDIENLYPEKYKSPKGLRTYAIITVDKQLLQEATEMVNLKQNTIQRYLYQFHKLGILKQLQKGNRHQQSLYAIGYWVSYYGTQRVQIFLTKEKPGIKTLQEFEVGRPSI